MIYGFNISMSQASCCFQHWHLGGADVLQRRKGSFHAPLDWLLTSSCYLIFLFLNERAEVVHLFYIWRAEF